MSKYKKFVQLLDEYTLPNTNPINEPLMQPFYIPELDYNLWRLYFQPLETHAGLKSHYELWKLQSEVHFDETLSIDNVLPDKLCIEPLITKTCHIDIEVNSISDLLDITVRYPYCSDTRYNIDLEALHKIAVELNLLNAMIGMDILKQSIINQLMYFIQNLHVGENVSDFKHTVISGPPGTGKTEVARIIGQMYSKLGILKKNIFKKYTSRS